MNKPSIRTRGDVIQLLKRFGILVYTGDPEGDDLLMEEELKELHQLKMIEDKEYFQAVMVLRGRKGP
ncbi:MAG: DUF910 family protein [Bacillaceae bacterium]|nr:DUF910 family protein [Bacillaceae bacterium]